MVYARAQLGHMYRSASQRRKMEFNAAGRDFEPTRNIKQGQVDIQCAAGMKGNTEELWCGQFLSIILLIFLLIFYSYILTL